MANVLEALIRFKAEGLSEVEAAKKAVEELHGEAEKLKGTDVSGAVSEIGDGAGASVPKVGDLKTGIEGLIQSVTGLEAVGSLGFVAMAGAAIAASAAVAGIGVMIEKITEQWITASVEQAKLNAETQIGIQTLNEWKAIGATVGVTQQDMASSASDLTKKLAEGAQKTTEALDAIGLGYEELRALSPDKQFERVVEALGGVQSASDRAAIAQRLFNDEAKVLPLVGTNFEEARRHAYEFGEVIEEGVTRRGAELAHQLGELDLQWDAFKQGLADSIAQSLGFKDALELLRDVLSVLPHLTGGVSIAVSTMTSAFTGFLPEIIKAVSALRDWKDLAAGLSQGAAGLYGIGLNANAGAAGGQDPVLKSFAEQAREKAKLEADFAKQLEQEARDEAARIAKLGREKLAEEKKVGRERITQARKDAAELVAAAKFAHDEQAHGEEALRRAQKEIDTERKTDIKSLEDLEKQASRDAIARMQDEITANLALQGAEQKAGEEARKRMSEEARAHRDAAAAAREHAQDLLSLGNALGNAAEQIGGFAGELLSLAGLGVTLAGNLKLAESGALSLTQKLAGVAQAAASIYSNGTGLLGGAASGAAAGAMFGPWGAAIGAVAGGILGIFGKSKKEAEAAKKALEAAKQEAAQLKEELLSTFGTMENAMKKARDLGMNLDAALQSTDPKVFKQAYEDLNKALDDQKKRLEALATAAGGLNKMVKADSIIDQGSFDRAGRYAMAIFAQMVKETGDVVGAIDMIGDTLDELAERSSPHTIIKKTIDEAGKVVDKMKLNPKTGEMEKVKKTIPGEFEPGAGLQSLLQMRKILKENEKLADQISGLQQLMKGLGDAGMVTKELFVDFGKDAVQQFNALQAAGAKPEQAMAILRGTIQQLWEEQQKFGRSTDASTNALIDQAVAQGIVGESGKDSFSKIIDILGLMAEALGAPLDKIRAITGELNDMPTQRDVNIDINYKEHGQRPPDSSTTTQDDGSGDRGERGGRPNAHGGVYPEWVRAARGYLAPNRPGSGTHIIAGEGGSQEVVAPVSALFGKLGDGMAAKVASAVMNSQGPTTLIVKLDGRVATKSIVRNTVRGRNNPRNRLRINALG